MIGSTDATAPMIARRKSAAQAAQACAGPEEVHGAQKFVYTHFTICIRNVTAVNITDCNQHRGQLPPRGGLYACPVIQRIFYVLEMYIYTAVSHAHGPSGSHRLVSHSSSLLTPSLSLKTRLWTNMGHLQFLAWLAARAMRRRGPTSESSVRNGL